MSIRSWLIGGTALALLLPSAAVRSAEVEVFVVRVQAADQEPTPTDVVLRKGQRFQVKARGQWCMGGTPPTAECDGPDGIRRANPIELPLLLNSAPIGKLLGRIGDGPFFPIGDGRNMRASRSGELFLIFNDRPCCFSDNSAFVTARIKPLPNRGPTS